MDQFYSAVLRISDIIILISQALMTIIIAFTVGWKFSGRGIDCLLYCPLIYSFVIIYKLNVHAFTDMRNYAVRVDTISFG